jgi:thioredoxin reductase
MTDRCETSAHDVVIIGGGAAGLSAALVLGRARRLVAVVDAGSPRNASAAHMQGYLSRDGMPPAELLAAGRAEVHRYGVQVITDQVEHAAPGPTVRLASGRVLTPRRLLLATGVRDDLPDIGGLQSRWGRDVLHCPYCHGWEVREQPLGVLGWHPASLQHALLVRQWSDDVTFFTHGRALTTDEHDRLRARGVTVVEGEVSRLVLHHDAVTGVEMSDGRVVPRSALFVRPLSSPNAQGLLASLGCGTDSDGFVTVDATGRTTAGGVWAAGNIVDPHAQVITAAGAGSAAAIAINADLVTDDVDYAVRGLPQATDASHAQAC